MGSDGPSPAGSRPGGRPVPASRRQGVPLHRKRGPSPAGSRPGADAASVAIPGSVPRAHVATPGRSVRDGAAMAITCRIAAKRLLTLATTPRAHVATPGPLGGDGAAPAGSRPGYVAPVPASRRRAFPCVGGFGHHLPDRGLAADPHSLDHRPVPASRRRGARAWTTWAAMGHHLPNRGQAATSAPCPRRDAASAAMGPSPAASGNAVEHFFPVKGREYKHDAQASGSGTHLLAPRACVCRIKVLHSVADRG
jgi:hypothetical protein